MTSVQTYRGTQTHHTSTFSWVALHISLTRQQGQNAQPHGLGQAQRGLLGTIDGGLAAVGEAQEELQKKAELPPLGDDPVSKYRVKLNSLLLRIIMNNSTLANCIGWGEKCYPFSAWYLLAQVQISDREAKT